MWIYKNFLMKFSTIHYESTAIKMNISIYEGGEGDTWSCHHDLNHEEQFLITTFILSEINDPMLPSLQTSQECPDGHYDCSCLESYMNVCEPLTKAYFSNFAPVSSFLASLPADHWSPLLGPEVNIFCWSVNVTLKVDTSEMLIFMN